LLCSCTHHNSDADIALAASHIIKGGFSYSGQRCTAVKVVLVMQDVADELVAKVRVSVPVLCACAFRVVGAVANGVNKANAVHCSTSRSSTVYHAVKATPLPHPQHTHTQVQAGVQKLSVGRPEDNADITAVVSSSSADFITGLVEDAKAKGAACLTPYKRCVFVGGGGRGSEPAALRCMCVCVCAVLHLTCTPHTHTHTHTHTHGRTLSHPAALPHQRQRGQPHLARAA
jgi:acyl-CoA reductase-like NAD-dependent aldehyde dehydrogenase